jgi:hypothetical protein
MLHSEENVLKHKQLNEGIGGTDWQENYYEAIGHTQYANFKQKEKTKMIYVDHFHEDLWKGYPIIEPTKRMREYVKP